MGHHSQHLALQVYYLSLFDGRTQWDWHLGLQLQQLQWLHYVALCYTAFLLP